MNRLTSATAQTVEKKKRLAVASVARLKTGAQQRQQNSILISLKFIRSLEKRMIPQHLSRRTNDAETATPNRQTLPA